MAQLAHRTALVTGAKRGIGREFVSQLLDRGAAKVYATARDPRTIAAGDPRLVPLQLDVTDASSVARAAAIAGRECRREQRRDRTRRFGPGLGRNAPRPDQRCLDRLVDLPCRHLRSVEGSAVERHRLYALGTRSQRVQVVGVYMAYVDTDMSAGAAAANSNPADVVRRVLDGVETAAVEIMTDDLTRAVRANLSQPVETRFAQFLLFRS